VIRSFLGTSLIDYPGKISSVIFFGGCNLYCPFCHNPELVRPDLLEEQFSLSEDDVLAALCERRGFVEGICVTGGEPLLHEGLAAFLSRLREETKLPVKLDTNGTLPSRLSEIIGSVDYLAIDVKASPDRYPDATGGRTTIAPVLESIALARQVKAYEVRTTMVPGIVSAEDLESVLYLTGRVKKYVVQRFRSEKTLSPEYTGIPPYPRSYLDATAERLRAFADEVVVRA
jgi:pyruvate formate lyase activating enzyme